MTRLLAAWRRHKLLATAFAAALLLTLFFAIRTAVFAVYWSDPAHRDQVLEGWMTPRYVAHSWRVPPEVMEAAVGETPARRRPTLDAIAEHQGVPLADLTARLEAAIAAHRAAAE